MSQQSQQIAFDPIQMHLAKGMDACAQVSRFVKGAATSRHLSDDDVVALMNAARIAEFTIKVLAQEVQRNRIPPAFKTVDEDDR